MNVDAKLASKSLALRVRKVLTSLIKADQMAYVKDRYIGESVRLINDMLEYADKNNIEAILFSANFEKAFDSIDHTFILAVLKSYGFGPDFIQWIKTLLNNAESCVKNGGKSTGYFPIQRGTRQGDPLSAYLSILALEVMLIQIRKHDSVRGITIGNIVIKLSAYADDTYFFGLDPCSIHSILATCDRFENFSSLKLNLEKSYTCWIGAAKYRSDTPIHCNWLNLMKDKILTLRVYNSYDVLLAEKYHLLNLISSVKDCLKTWKYRELTLGGRIQILKSLALSKIVYIGTMIDVSKQFIEQLDSLQKDFIWNGRRPKIKHSTLIADYVEERHKDIDIKTKLSLLKVIWIKKLMDDNFHAWKAIPMAWLSNNASIQIFNENFKPSQYFFA